MVSERQWRLRMVEIGRRMYQRQYIAAADGNISVRLGDKILITPAGSSKGFMQPDDLLVVDISGKVLRGRGRPSTEMGMHLTIYNHCPGIHAVIHGHPLYATTLAICGIGLTEPLLPEVITTLGTVPLAPYATPGTAEVGESIRPFLPDHQSILLQNHGLVTTGDELDTAWRHFERSEHAARIVYQAHLIGRTTPLSPQQVAQLRTTNPYRS